MVAEMDARSESQPFDYFTVRRQRQDVPNIAPSDARQHGRGGEVSAEVPPHGAFNKLMPPFTVESVSSGQVPGSRHAATDAPDVPCRSIGRRDRSDTALVDPTCGRSAHPTECQQDPRSNRACGSPAHGLPVVVQRAALCPTCGTAVWTLSAGVQLLVRFFWSASRARPSRGPSIRTWINRPRPAPQETWRRPFFHCRRDRSEWPQAKRAVSPDATAVRHSPRAAVR